VHCDKPKKEGSWCCEKHQQKALPWKMNVSLMSLRPKVMQSDAVAKETPMAWQCHVPYDTRQLAIKDAVTGYKACTTNLKRGHIAHFDMRFQKRSSRRIFWVDSGALVHKKGKLRIFQQRLKEDSVLRLQPKDRKNIVSLLGHDAKIQYDRGAYYLLLTQINDPIPTVHEKRHPIVALDPGVRTFQTGYSPTGVAFKAGDAQIEIMKRLHKRIDALRSVRSTVSKRRTRWRLKQRLEKLERTVRGLVDDLHNQTAAALTRNFQTILLPSFGTSKMLEGDGLAACTKRRMQGLCHYRFQQKLIHQCHKHGNTLFLVGEEYTTKACGGCGALKMVGGDRTYECAHCGYAMDRDVHGARNILLKTCSTFGR
jgi:transposase